VIVGLIPALNEADRIGQVIARARPFLDKMIVCDDGSSDDTGQVAQHFGAEVITHSRTRGYGAALRSMFLRALQLRPIVAVTIDADGQHDPTSIPSLARPILEGEADIVLGSRFLGRRSSIPAARLAGILLVTKFTELLTRCRITDSQCGLRCYSYSALKSVVPHDNGMGASVEILFLAHRKRMRIVEGPTTVYYNGESDSSKDSLSHLISLLQATLKSGILGLDGSELFPFIAKSSDS